MNHYYTNEKNILLLIALLKEHKISKVIASPGGSNSSFVTSLQYDPFFDIYSCVDERSAAYMACGFAAENQEPVILSCTGATASRNYLPGMTEAFYRKLPIVAITSTREISLVGHHIPQVTDRSQFPKDTIKLSVTLPIIKDKNDIWDCEIKINEALLELNHNGGGPVHINATTNETGFDVKELPPVRVIKRIIVEDEFPKLPNCKIAIFISSKFNFATSEIQIIDDFCKLNNAVVFHDHTSGYNGNYGVNFSIVACQEKCSNSAFMPDLAIHIGEISGDYFIHRFSGKNIWRVNEDGKIRDTFKKLSYIFEMKIQTFFRNYIEHENNEIKDTYLSSCKKRLETIYTKIPNLPFSNIWIASQISKKIPENSTMHFAILNSLRSWNFFELSNMVKSSANVGGFGIDGCLSTIIGSSLANKNKLHFGIIGDLAFFYDMNALGNREIKNNLRILLINNGKGAEFKIHINSASEIGSETDKYIAAAGHFGNRSKKLVKHYAEDLGIEYISAENKNEFIELASIFINPKITDKSILFEVFTNDFDESEALKRIMSLEQDNEQIAKNVVKKLIGDKGLRIAKNMFGRE